MTICLGQSSADAYSYNSIAKVDLDTGKCPEPFLPCSELTSTKNTVCVRSGEKPHLCPITDVKIIEKANLAEFESTGQAKYERAPEPAGADLNWTLLFSKEFDSAPISEFELDVTPSCILRRVNYRIGDPKKELLEIQEQNGVYKTERTFYNCLKPDGFVSMRRDQFKPVNSETFRFNEYDLLDSAGVWTSFEALI